MKYVLYTDGGARGNPGPAGAGFVVWEFGSKREVVRGKKYLGEATNNQAEYEALILGLRECVKLGCKEIAVRMDSELIVKQLQGIYRVKNEKLKPLFARVLIMTNEFDNITYKHIPRENNKIADKLANLAMDEGA